MNRKLTLKNCWKKREFTIRKCKGIISNEDLNDLYNFKTKLGFMDVILSNITILNNKKIFTPSYDFVFDFSEKGIATMIVNDKYGYIREDGSVLVEPKFDDALHFFANISFVKLNNKWGVINLDGEIITDFIYDDFTHHDYNFFVKKDNLWGVLNENAEYVFDPDVFTDVQETLPHNPDFKRVVLNKKVYYLNKYLDFFVKDEKNNYERVEHL